MSAIIDIIILLLVCLFIYSKLRSVLGTRPEITITKETKISDEAAAKIFELIEKEAQKQEEAPIKEENLTGVDAILAEIPNFNKEKFLTGAKKAFEIIITAFAKGDTQTLEGLVSKSLIKKFAEIIEQRKKDNITSETDLISFISAEVSDAKVGKENAKISVTFTTEQVNILKNAQNEIIEGDENFIQNITDIWTFERPLTSPNPNWLLISTKKR